MAHVHREPYITLAGLTETSALIAWGAFFFNVDSEQLDGRYKIVEDRDLTFLNPKRKTTIHPHTREVIERLVPVFERGGVRLVLSGHEHNLQMRTRNGVNYVLTGGAGEVRPDQLTNADAKTDGVAWSPRPHFILCEYKAGKLTVTPYGELAGGKLKPLAGVKGPQGKPFKLPPLSLD
jgi:hypothetical protein